MGLFGGSNTQVQKTVSEPWTAQQPFLKKSMKKANDLYSSGSGFNAYPGQTWVDPSQATQTAENQTMDIAGQGNPLAQQSMSGISGILGQQVDPRYNDLYDQSSNPFFNSVVDTQAGKLTGDIAGYYDSLGRFGSDAMTGAMVDQVGDFRNKMASDNWNQNIANQRGILGDRTNAQLGLNSSQLNAISAAPGAYEQQYLPSQHMAQVGAQQEDAATRKLQAQIDQFNTQDMAKWNRLNAMNGVVTGAGAGGGTSTSTVQQPKNYLAPLGGGLLGAQAGQAMGGSGLLGGLGGLLAGIFG